MGYDRVRCDHIFGTLGADLASASAFATSTITAAILTEAPAVIAGEALPVILDAERAGGAPEIGWITDHGAGSSTATLMRGLEGTLPRSHGTGVKLFVGPTKTDFIDDPWIDVVKALKCKGNDSFDNTTLINAAFVLASVGASWTLAPSPNMDAAVPILFRPGTYRHTGELKMVDAVPKLIGSGADVTWLKDMRAGATKAWTVSATNGSAVLTVTSGGPPVADDKSMVIRGTGIPDGAFIVAVSGNDVTISTPFTGSTGSVAATVITVVSLGVRATAANDRIADLEISDLKIWPDTASGHDNRILLLARHVSHALFKSVRWGDGLAAVFGHDLWDSRFVDTDIQYCGSRAAEQFGAVHLTASSQDISDCNKVELDHATFENNYRHDLAMVGHGRRVNKCVVYGGSKFETSVARGHRILLSTTDAVTIDGSTDISVGGFDTGYSTPVDGIHAIDSLGLDTDGVNVEQKPSSGVAVLRHGVHWNGEVVAHRPRKVRMSNAGGNPAFTGKAFHCTGTNTALPDPGHWTYDGSSSEPEVSSLPSVWKRGRIDWTPTFSGGGAPNLGSTGYILGDFSVDPNNEVHYNIWGKFAGTGRTAGTGVWAFNLPVPADLSLITAGATSRGAGAAVMVQAGGLTAGSHVIGTVAINSAGKAVVVVEVAAQTDSPYLGAACPFAWSAVDDAFHLFGTYPAGSGV